ncbi:MAG: carboxylating nicotinate-nucleotide diphosphorylase, partial [Bacteroidota bacterium]
HLLVKEPGILAGIEVAARIFRTVDPDVDLDIRLQDGAAVQPGDIGLVVSGTVHTILKSERLVLNCMQRMSGIATHTHRISERLAGTKARVLDTRKTTPGMRMLEKWAVRIGGGTNHRQGLYDMIMIKDNHIDFAGGIPEALNATFAYRAKQQLDIPVEIETRNLDEVATVLADGRAHRIMLDNFSPELTREAVAMVGGSMETESSGGITMDTIADYAACGVDFISVGALTHSVKSLDLSLKAIS